MIQPPVLRPQHVYAPVAPLGMLSLGVLSKHKKEARGGIRDDASNDSLDKVQFSMFYQDNCRETQWPFHASNVAMYFCYWMCMH